jgi:hypothetical protein
MTNPTNLDVAMGTAQTLRTEAAQIRKASVHHGVNAELAQTLEDIAQEREEKADRVLARGYRLHFYATQRAQVAQVLADVLGGKVWDKGGDFVRVYRGDSYLSVVDVLSAFTDDLMGTRTYWCQQGRWFPPNATEMATINTAVQSAFTTWKQEQA